MLLVTEAYSHQVPLHRIPYNAEQLPCIMAHESFSATITRPHVVSTRDGSVLAVTSGACVTMILGMTFTGDQKISRKTALQTNVPVKAILFGGKFSNTGLCVFVVVYDYTLHLMQVTPQMFTKRKWKSEWNCYITPSVDAAVRNVCLHVPDTADVHMNSWFFYVFVELMDNTLVCYRVNQFTYSAMWTVQLPSRHTGMPYSLQLQDDIMYFDSLQALVVIRRDATENLSMFTIQCAFRDTLPMQLPGEMFPPLLSMGADVPVLPTGPDHMEFGGKGAIITAATFVDANVDSTVWEHGDNKRRIVLAVTITTAGEMKHYMVCLDPARFDAGHNTMSSVNVCWILRVNMSGGLTLRCIHSLCVDVSPGTGGVVHALQYVDKGCGDNGSAGEGRFCDDGNGNFKVTSLFLSDGSYAFPDRGATWSLSTLFPPMLFAYNTGMWASWMGRPFGDVGKCRKRRAPVVERAECIPGEGVDAASERERLPTDFPPLGGWGEDSADLGYLMSSVTANTHVKEEMLRSVDHLSDP